ncbi:MAG: methyltransferase domain-containing protein [Caldilineae bacterium]|nr:MAG: methyltransferase domain-containing protein [Caldilineae bacterium]
MKATMEYLYAVRDRVLDNAQLQEGDILLDVGCGDGLIAFGALERSATVHVIFSDISQDLLDHARTIARRMGVLPRCRFVRAPAEDLSPIEGESVDVVTTRSVLIYVRNKQQAFCEFYRVLKAGGRLSIFEPINRFGYPEPPDLFWGYDVAPVAEIARKLKALYQRLQPPASDPMLDFDERDLLAFAEKAGFREIHLELQVDIRPKDKVGWEALLRTAGNPKIPTLEEAMEQVLSPAERETFAAYLRPLAETGQGVTRRAVAYLWAGK